MQMDMVRKSGVGVSVCALIVGGVMLSQGRASTSNPEPYVGLLADSAEVQANRDNPRDMLAFAYAKADEGALREAAFAATAYLMTAPSGDGYRLYVDIYMRKAQQAVAAGHHAVATRMVKEALQALDHWQTAVATRGRLDASEVESVFEVDQAIRLAVSELADAALETAVELRDASVRPFWRRDCRSTMIDALVVLDALDPAIMDPGLRERHARIWTDLFKRLGTQDIKVYKVRSNLASL